MSSRYRTIAIVGAGALGLYYGGRLARMYQDVTFLARSDLKVLNREGVVVKFPGEEFVVPHVKAVAASEEIGPVDLVVITLKATANGELGRLLPPLLHDQTVVLNLQNGLGVDEEVAAVVGGKRVVGGLCFVCVNRTSPGVAECTMPGQIVIGEFAGPPQARTYELRELFESSGVKMEVHGSLAAVRWRKLVWNVPFNGLAVAKGGVTTEDILRSAEAESEVWGLMREVQAIAAAHGVLIPDDFVVDQVERTRPMGPYRPSTMLDYVAGKPLEVEPIWGEPLRRAKAVGVKTPRLELLYEKLRQLAQDRIVKS